MLFVLFSRLVLTEFVKLSALLIIDFVELTIFSLKFSTFKEILYVFSRIQLLECIIFSFTISLKLWVQSIKILLYSFCFKQFKFSVISINFVFTIHELIFSDFTKFSPSNKFKLLFL
uniref:Uncharacterized protein n=1 Tax=Meloidogyne enterolobii TaxID=390850 RepID=A0A6V7VZT9_MELEN|nr:unnamed protein product [Meloidogyne enterolobii]